MIFQPICDARGRVKNWVKKLAGKSGVYVIRKPGLIFQTTLYVGESHSGRLKKTVLRHFQKWTGKTSGPTYSRHKVEVAVMICAESESVERQNQLIRELDPVDNVVEKPTTPF